MCPRSNTGDQQAVDDTARYAAEVQGYTQQAVLSAQQIKEDTDTGLLVAQDIAQQVAVVNMAVSRVVEDASYVEQAVIRTLDKAPVDSPVLPERRRHRHRTDRR